MGDCKHQLSLSKESNVEIELSKSSETPSSSIHTPTNIVKYNKSKLQDDCKENLLSPLEFRRFTSTPMQIPIVKINSSTPTLSRTANFSLKTPTTPEKIGDNELQIQLSTPSVLIIDKNESQLSDKIKKTPLKSILSLKNDLDESKSGLRKLTRKLSSMEELNETSDMEMTNPCDGVLCETNKQKISETDEQKSLKNSNKKVRFIDEPDEATVEQKIDSSCLELTKYFDAEQGLPEDSIVCVDEITKITGFVDEKMEKFGDEKKELITDEFKEIAKVRTTISIQENKSDEKVDSLPSGSSRVVMMVLVERNFDSSPSDLAPLINTGLKKLENFSSNLVKISDNEKDKKSSMSTVDTWSTVSTIERLKSPPTSKIERFKSSPVSTKSSPTLSPINHESPEKKVDNNSGIFFTVANAVKNAICSFAGNGLKSKNPNNDYSKFEMKPSASSTIVLPSTSSFVDNKTVSYLPVESRLLSPKSRPLVPSLSPFMSSPFLAGSSGKRRRDDDLAVFSPMANANRDRFKDEDSPSYKKIKTWNIRARDPIARMRNFSSQSSDGSQKNPFSTQQDVKAGEKADSTNSYGFSFD